MFLYTLEFVITILLNLRLDLMPDTYLILIALAGYGLLNYIYAKMNQIATADPLN